MTKLFNVGTYAVRGENGEIDEQATLDKFQRELFSQVSHERNDLDLISSAVNEVFSRYPGVNITTDLITHAVLRTLNVDVLDDALMTKRVKTYLKDNTGDFLVKRESFSSVIRVKTVEFVGGANTLINLRSPQRIISEIIIISNQL